MTAFTAIVPTQNVHEKNPVNNPLAPLGVTLEQVALTADQTEATDEQGIWASIMGPDSTMPAPRTSFRDVSITPGNVAQDPAETTAPTPTTSVSDVSITSGTGGTPADPNDPLGTTLTTTI